MPTPRLPWLPPLVLVAGAALGVLLGAMTNVVNASVSPYYFQAIMGWQRDVFGRTVRQGMLEGGILGIVFGLVVALSMAASTGLRGSISLALGALGRAASAAVVCWGLGGVAAMILASTKPEGYAATFRDVPADPAERLRFAWVGGSIWGAYAGMVVGATIACVRIHRQWAREQGATGFAMLPAARR